MSLSLDNRLTLAPLPRSPPAVNDGGSERIEEGCFEQGCIKASQGYQLVIEGAGIFSKACEFLGPGHSVKIVEALPFINLIGIPFYLYHSLKEAKDDAGLTLAALRTRHLGDGFFWGMKTVDALGNTLENLIKGYLGGIQISGLAQTTLLGLSFTVVIPVALIISSSIGAVSEGIALVRSIRALGRFNSQSKQSLIETTAMRALLGKLATSHDNKVDNANFLLAERTSEKRNESIKKEAKRLLEQGVVEKIETHLRALKGREGFEERIATLERARTLYQKIRTLPAGTEGQAIGEALELYRLLQCDPAFKGSELAGVAQAQEKELRKLLAPLEALHDRALSEIHRAILSHAVLLLISLLVIASGVLYFSAQPPNGHTNVLSTSDMQSAKEYTLDANILSLVSSVLSLAYLIFDKQLSSETFIKFERAVRLLPKR